MDNLESLKGIIVIWNKKVFGNIFERKRKLISELKKIQMILDCHFSKKLYDRELILRRELEEVLSHEELLWFQKSRAEWLKHGDRNTSYFHNRSLVRHMRNRIEGLMFGDDWIF